MKNSKKKLVSRAGFTLVELVVTIAVLAILAGVGATAYGGYIKRAEEAKDLAKLADVLTVIQSAAAADGMTVPKVEINADKKITAPELNVAGKALFEQITGKTVDSYTVDLSSENYSKGAHWTPDKGWEAGPTVPV